MALSDDVGVLAGARAQLVAAIVLDFLSLAVAVWLAGGARTLDGLKFRTRAGMGRCQGGFCTARCMELLARDLDLDLAQVTKRGGDSWLVLDRDDVAGGAS